MGCTHQTVLNELRRGMTTQIGPNHCRFQAYFAETGQAVYERHRRHRGRRLKLATASAFRPMLNKRCNQLPVDRQTPSAAQPARNPFWQGKPRVCTKTLYHYIDRGSLAVKNIDLPNKLRYAAKKPRHRPNKKHLDDSIDQRPAAVNQRRSFGHWEIDTVIGRKSREGDVLLTLVERQTRCEIACKIDGKDPDSVSYTLRKLKRQYGQYFNRVFRSITADNGSEFSQLPAQLRGDGIQVYYTHPYAAWERPTNERYNGLIRWFIPKGRAFADYSRTFICQAIRVLNHLPRRILQYRTPAQAFALSELNS
ncbi:MAG: IS30 family transposase [Sporolactobacillus sp.]|nr:IS30 family transposase [Sporolactobacillus sp.]